MAPELEECPFCGYCHENIGDLYGCPNCNGEGLEDDSWERKEWKDQMIQDQGLEP